ncbi:hypothetical protein Q8A73_003792 [Channa argus]|nr:hypothetical protein Q8A73_003792 [Channa argus]
MHKYCWPGFEMYLIRELQRQQNSAQFCDTLLQTDGISVPTHSCILAALSPHLSQRLSASASPPSGQKRQLHLQPVKAQTLLKLVGLLYSGELEVNESIELNDVLAVAHQLGIRDLVKRQKDGGMKEWEIQGKIQGNGINAQGCEREEKRKMQDVQVQAGMAGRRDTVSQVKSRSCVSTGTQTVTTGEKPVGSCVTCFSKSPTPECVHSQNVEFSVMLPPQHIALDEQFCFPSCPVIPSMPSGAPNHTPSTLNRSACSVISPESTFSPNNAMAIPSDESKTLLAQEDGTYQRFSECGNNIQALAKERTGLEDGGTSRYTADNRATEQTRQAKRDEVLGDDRGTFTEKRQAHGIVGKKNLARIKQMQQMIETTQISIKVKLRRRSNGEVWEVVSPQDTDKTLSVLAFQQQGGSNSEPPPYTVELFGVHKPEKPILKPTTTNSPSLEAASLPQSQGPVEECDEQIEKLLEDIMMGLNILPNLESKKPHPIQPSLDGASTIFPVPVAQNDAGNSQTQAAVSQAGCGFYQDFGTQSGHSSTGIHCCLPAQNQPDTSISMAQTDAVLIQQQGQRDSERMSCQTMLPSKSQECLHPEPITKQMVIPSAFLCSGQKQYYQEYQQTSLQDSQRILGFLPLVTGNDTQTLPPGPPPCMDDFRLPPCLSPLESCTSATKHQAILNPMNLGNKLQQQPCLHGRPWLSENPGSLQFPLSAINHRQNKCACLSKHTNCSCWSKQQHEEKNPQSGGTWAEPCTVQEVKEKEIITGSLQNVAELKSDPRKIKKGLKGQQGDRAGNAITFLRRKRKLPSPLQDAGSLLADKDVKVSAGTKGQINLSSCSVSLFSNNALVKKRAVATCSSNTPSILLGKSNQLSPFKESLRTKESGVITEQTRIITRGFIKRNQESPCSTSSQNPLVSKSLSFRSKIVNSGDTVSKRKRGRPRKAKVEDLSSAESNPAVDEGKIHSGECEQQIDRDLSKEDLEKGDKTRRELKKTRRNRGASLGITTLKNLGSKRTSKSDANNNDIIPTVRPLRTPKRLPMVSLKDFQKLIKLQHSKTRKSIESQEKYDPLRAGMVSRDGTCKGSGNDSKMDVDAKFHSSGRSEESVTFSVTVEEDHRQNFNELTAEQEALQQDDTESFPGKETSLFGDSLAFSGDVLPEEVPRLDAKRKPLKNPDEGEKSCNAKGSFTTVESPIDIEGLSHSDMDQEDKLVSDHNLYPQAPETAGPSFLYDGGISRTSSCAQEEEEVEVDVVVYSPDKVLQTKDCEDGLNKIEITPDEDEEEDVNDIDVTGDESE